MKTNVQTKRLWGRALACGFLLAVVQSLFPFAASCETLQDRVIRLHVVANSNTGRDQALKLKVRDAVLEEAAQWYQGAATREEANSLLCVHLDSIRAAAERALRENGSGDSAAVQISDLYFPTREYESFRLPAGKYRALRVTIGRGEGKNWWCVAFPSLCLPAASDRKGDCLDILTPQEQKIVKNPEKYEIKWKVVELYENFRQWLEGR